MISLYFGLPGCGKTTLMVSHAIKGLKKYTHVYCNTPINVEGVIYVSNEEIGFKQLENGLLLIDEASLFADSRDYKNFQKEQVRFFLLHRHYGLTIELYTQQWDAVDRKIRVITDKVYYMWKPKIFSWVSKYYRIPYGIIIPDPKKQQGGEKLGEIVQGYSKPPLLSRLFAHRLRRRKYYKYFDSWSAPKLPQTDAETLFLAAQVALIKGDAQILYDD